ncbi:MAG TPA: replicative DNA helicase [Clostridiaceae bacterium]|nr:replicative DNA helicase [Clostridiaceae bacterium]
MISEQASLPGKPINLSERLKGHALPHNIAMEQSVLGCAMLRLEALSAMISKLRFSDFYDPRHQLIFEAIEMLHIDQKPCDILTVTNQLILNEKIGSAGGREYVLSLPGSVPFVANYASYIELVRGLSLKRRLIMALDGVIEHTFSSDLEAEQLIELAAQRILNIREDESDLGLVRVGEVLSDRVNELHLMSTGVRVQSPKTGYPGLDRVLGGLRKGALYVLASRPGVGKSALSLNIAHNVARYYDAVVAIFSLEMSKEEVATRLLSAKTAMSFQQLETLDEKDKRAWDKIAAGLGELYDVPLYIDDHSSVNVVEIHARCRQLQLKHKRLDLVVVDYLQLMGTASGRSRAENRQQQIAEISRMLKVMARDLDVPVLALSQLSREVDKAGRRPRLADLRESGAIEQDADVVMFLHDPDAKEGDKDYKEEITEVDLIVEKNRQGERALITLQWNPEILTFTEDDYGGTPEAPFAPFR